MTVVAFTANTSRQVQYTGTTLYGTAPTEFTGYGKETMVFLIHNFADLQEERGKCIKTETIRACGHKWKLNIFPRGTADSISIVKYSSIFFEL